MWGGPLVLLLVRCQPAGWAFSYCEGLFCDRKAARGRAAQAKGPTLPDFRQKRHREDYAALACTAPVSEW
jgi:hypothetical protein